MPVPTVLETSELDNRHESDGSFGVSIGELLLHELESGEGLAELLSGNTQRRELLYGGGRRGTNRWRA
jgi:hypothetical protein